MHDNFENDQNAIIELIGVIDSMQARLNELAVSHKQLCNHVLERTCASMGHELITTAILGVVASTATSELIQLTAARAARSLETLDDTDGSIGRYIDRITDTAAAIATAERQN